MLAELSYSPFWDGLLQDWIYVRILNFFDRVSGQVADRHGWLTIVPATETAKG